MAIMLNAFCNIDKNPPILSFRRIMFMRSLRFVFNLLFCFFFAQRNKPYDDGAKQKVNGKFKNEVDSHKAGKHIFCCGFKAESLCPSRNCGHKKMRRPRRKIPVFTMGQVTAAVAVARYLFFFSKALYIRPESVPARMPLTRTVATVPNAFTARKAAASPVRSTVTPKTRPSHAPAPIP